MKTYNFILMVIVTTLFVFGSTASAGSTLNLTIPNDGSAHFAGLMDVGVTLNGQTISVECIRNDTFVDPAVDKIYYHLDENVVSIMDERNDPTAWESDIKTPNGHNVANFGKFLTECTMKSNSYRTAGPIVITLDEGFGEAIPLNDKGHSMAVHVRVRSADDGSDDSVWLTNGNGHEIPEFPTIALPIVAILGLALIFNRRDNN